MIKVELSNGIYNPSIHSITVRHHFGKVILLTSDKAYEMETPASYKIGVSLIKVSDKALNGDYVSMSVNGELLPLMPAQAKQLGGAILRKTIQADDYQLAIGA